MADKPLALPRGRYTAAQGAYFKSYQGPPARPPEIPGLASKLANSLVYRMQSEGLHCLSGSATQPDGTVYHCVVYRNARGEPIVAMHVVAPDSTMSRPRRQLVSSYGGFLFSPLFGEDAFGKVFWRTVEYSPHYSDQRTPLWRQRETFDGLPEPTSVSRKASAPVNWCGVMEDEEGRVQEAVISYNHGLKTRYRLYIDQDCSGRFIKMEGEFPVFAQSGFPTIYWNGRAWRTEYEQTPAQYAPDGTVEEPAQMLEFNVVGAAACGEFFVAISHVDPDYVEDPAKTTTENAIAKSQANSSRATVFYARPGGAWKVAGSHDYGFFLKNPWFFSPDGTQAVSIRDLNNNDQARLDIRLSVVGDSVVAEFDEPTTYADSTSVYYSYLAPLDIETVEAVSGFFDANDPANYDLGEALFIVGDEERADVLNYLQENCEYLQDNPDAYVNLSRGPVLTDGGWLRPFASLGLVGTVWTFYGGLLRCSVNGVFWRRHFHQDYYYSRKETLREHEAKGKRYIAVDFDSEGEERVVTLSFEPVGTIEVRGYSYVDTVLKAWLSGYETYSASCSVTRTTKKGKMSGAVRWVLRVNDDDLVESFGGIEDGGSYERTWVHEAPGTDCGDAEATLEHSDSRFITERLWLQELDARTKSCIYEKTRLVFGIDESDTFTMSVAQAWYNLQEYNAYLVEGENLYCTVVDGAERKRESKALSEGGYLMRGYSLFMQLLPRFYGLEDGLEELAMPQRLVWPADQYSNFEADRRWRLAVNDIPHDFHPHRLLPAELQSRFEDVVFSGYDRSARIITYFNPPDGVLERPLYDPTYIHDAMIRGQEFDPKQVVIGMEVEDAITTGDFYAAPILTI